MTTVEQERLVVGAVGTARPRLDANVKLRGQARYAGDGEPPGLLHGRPVLSPHAHARILRIEFAAALQVPGVHSVLVAADLPIRDRGGRAGEPLARSEVVFAGQPVALVLAESEAAAQDGLEAVDVTYEPLEAVVDLDRALDEGTPPARHDLSSDDSEAGMHGYIGGHDRERAGVPSHANLTGQYSFEQGDVEEVFADCAATVEGRFRSSWVYQSCLEPQVAVAWPEGDGGIRVRSSTQSVFYVRQHLAKIFGLSLGSVRVEAATLGGGFGAKLGLLEPLAAGAALAVGRPVRIMFTRSEDFAAGNPAPALVIDLKLGAHADGTFAALQAKVLIDNGAFTDSAPSALAGGRLSGPYRWQAWDVLALGVRTNRFNAGAYRAPTTPQSTFALESLVDELALKLERDPVELRRLNVAERGDRRFDGTLWPEIGLEQVLDRVAEHPLLQRRGRLPRYEGIGIAAGHYPGARQGAAATCRLDGDGGFTVIVGYVDASGAESSVVAVAADTLGVPYEQVRLAVSSDSATGPQSGVSGGSMVTYCLGSAVGAAALDAREQLLTIAAFELEADRSDLVISGGSIHPRGSPERGISLARLGERLTGFGSSHPPVEGHGTALPPESAPSTSVAVAHVRVDPDTGSVRVLDYLAAQDVGRAINPSLCEGQMTGGAVQAIGLALLEQLVHGKDGRLLNGSFATYAIPKIEALPPIQTIIVEVPAPYGPFGAKGIGEAAGVPGAAAVANAIAAATGVRFNAIPITAREVWQRLTAV